MDPKLEQLKHIVLRQTFKYSDEPVFKLASGAVSNFYFDCKKTTLDPEGAYLIGQILYDRVKNWPIVGVGGLTLGADPIASALMLAAWGYNRRIAQFIVRKELKGHGAVKWIEGSLNQDDRVLIVDDVATTGGSVIKAIERAREDGLIVHGVYVLVDREEFDGMEKVRQTVPGCPVEALITRTEIMDLFHEKMLCSARLKPN
jgi:orotate phosphoribosyltransferase